MNPDDKQVALYMALGIVTACTRTNGFPPEEAARTFSDMAATFHKHGITGAFPEGLKEAASVIRDVLDGIQKGTLTPGNIGAYLEKKFGVSAFNPSSLN